MSNVPNAPIIHVNFWLVKWLHARNRYERIQAEIMVSSFQGCLTAMPYMLKPPVRPLHGVNCRISFTICYCVCPFRRTLRMGNSWKLQQNCHLVILCQNREWHLVARQRKYRCAIYAKHTTTLTSCSWCWRMWFWQVFEQLYPRYR